MDRDEGDAASPANSAVAIRGAEDVSLWREHHVVERLREHRRGEKGHGPEGFRADIDEIVTQRRREHKDAARAYGMLAAILEQQLTGAGDNVLRFLGGVRVPAEMSAGFDFVNDGGRLRRAVPAVESERGIPFHRRIILCADGILSSLSEATIRAFISPR
jgi:hypothetical protein